MALLAQIERADGVGIAAAKEDGGFKALFAGDPAYPGDLDTAVQNGSAGLARAADIVLDQGREIDIADYRLLPPLRHPGKIVCVGLNYHDHTAEVALEQPDYPLIFARFPSGLIGHGSDILRSPISEQLDYEGEFVAVIGKRGKHIAPEDALAYVAAYSLFNDVSVRDYQRRTPQWTVGKNFDTSGPFGPWLVTADALPPGARGLRIRTRVNGDTRQDANTDDLVFDVQTLIATLSQAFTLEPGDLIVTGTSAGVGGARKPPLWLRAGDTVEIEMEGIGILRNAIRDEQQ